MKKYFNVPLYLLVHPLKGYYELKFEKKGNLKVPTVFMILYCFVSVIKYQYVGFIFNPNNLNNLNSIMQIIYTILPLGLFIVANYSITTLFDGSGHLKDIYMVIGYNLFFLITFDLLTIVLSHLMTLNELTFYQFFTGIGWFLFLFLTFFGLLTIHEYSLSKNILTIALTFVSIGIIIFILLLSVTVLENIIQFFYSLYKELSLRR